MHLGIGEAPAHDAVDERQQWRTETEVHHGDVVRPVGARRPRVFELEDGGVRAGRASSHLM